VVLTLGHHGEAVVLGRGAHCILPRECSLRVRLAAPFEKRARRISELAGIPLAEAQARARHLDAERAGFVRRFFNSDAASPLNYDLVINTEDMGIEGATQVVLGALRAKLGVAEPTASA
jgi:cytidylate kinase